MNNDHVYQQNYVTSVNIDLQNRLHQQQAKSEHKHTTYFTSWYRWSSSLIFLWYNSLFYPSNNIIFQPSNNIIFYPSNNIIFYPSNNIIFQPSEYVSNLTFRPSNNEHQCGRLSRSKEEVISDKVQSKSSLLHLLRAT